MESNWHHRIEWVVGGCHRVWWYTKGWTGALTTVVRAGSPAWSSPGSVFRPDGVTIWAQNLGRWGTPKSSVSGLPLEGLTPGPCPGGEAPEEAVCRRLQGWEWGEGSTLCSSPPWTAGRPQLDQNPTGTHQQLGFQQHGPCKMGVPSYLRPCYTSLPCSQGWIHGTWWSSTQDIRMIGSSSTGQSCANARWSSAKKNLKRDYHLTGLVIGTLHVIVMSHGMQVSNSCFRRIMYHPRLQICDIYM